MGWGFSWGKLMGLGWSQGSRTGACCELGLCLGSSGGCCLEKVVELKVSAGWGPAWTVLAGQLEFQVLLNSLPLF